MRHQTRKCRSTVTLSFNQQIQNLIRITERPQAKRQDISNFTFWIVIYIVLPHLILKIVGKLILVEKSFQTSTNGIESLNRALKHYLGLGRLDQKRLDKEMHRFHSVKLIEAYDALNSGRLNKKRRRTLARESDLSGILSEFESLSESEQVENLEYLAVELCVRLNSVP